MFQGFFHAIVDVTVYNVTVEPEKTAAVTVTEVPQSNPIRRRKACRTWIFKTDAGKAIRLCTFYRSKKNGNSSAQYFAFTAKYVRTCKLCQEGIRSTLRFGPF